MGESFAWTIPMIQAGFGALFLAARQAGAAPEARWWGLAFLLSAAAFAVPALAPFVPIELVAVSADTFFAVSFYHFGGALLVRYGGLRFPRLRLAVLTVAIAAPAAAVLALGSLTGELLASDVTCALQLLLALVLVGWPKPWLDRVMILLSWLVVADNLARSASIPFTAAGATFSTFLGTSYSQLMLASGMLTGFGFALSALVAVMTDVVAGHRRDALVDPLTGLLNRRGLDAVVAEARPARTDGIVSCDLDHFKRVNDTWGHAAGDRVLVAFSDLIRAVLPLGAVAARTGGEEFVLYLPGHDAARTGAVAGRLKAEMAAFDWQATGIAVRQTASFGIAAGEGGPAGIPDSMHRADALMYEAKARGRDRIAGAVALPTTADA